MAWSPQKAKRRSMSRSNSGGFFACFRPGVEERDDFLDRSRISPIKGGIDERAVTAYIPLDDGKEIAPCPRGYKREVDDRPPKGTVRKRFVRATKAVFLEMSLVKKDQKKRKSKKTEEPSGNLLKKADRILRLMSQGSSAAGKSDSCKDSTRSDYNVSMSSHSSTGATSLSWAGSNRLLSSGGSSFNLLDAGVAKLLSRSTSSEHKRTGQDKPPPVLAKRFSSLADTPMCLILLTLALLIFWGKVCAIVFASTCLMVSVPSWPPRRALSDEGEDLVDSTEYKKRIIMEGLLQRQRPLAPQQSPSS